jgi:hypothetical protein
MVIFHKYLALFHKQPARLDMWISALLYQSD